MSDINPDLAAQEVDADLRRDQLNAMWKAYGRYIIGGAVGVVLAVGGTQLYNYQIRSAQEANSDIFNDAVVRAQAAGADSAAIWAETVSKLDSGYAALAELREAAALAESGDYRAAIKAYDRLAASTNGDLILREYAQLMAGLLVVDKVGDLDEARSRFTVLAGADQPWHYSALEQMAFIDMKQGDNAAAYEGFAALADSTNVPQSIGARARQFRDMLERTLPKLAADPVEQLENAPQPIEAEAPSDEG